MTFNLFQAKIFSGVIIMKHIIEDLWNGSITPGEYCGVGNPELKELEKLIERNRGDLNQQLNEHQKKILEKYIDCTEEYLDLLMVQAFSDGFCLASKLLTEALT